MDKKCINCRYFRLGSVGPTKADYIWGDCLNAKHHPWNADRAGQSVNFTWGDACCENFEPKQTSADKRALDAE